MPRGVTRSPLPWLAGLVVLYLGVPLVAFGIRLVTSHDRGFHTPGLFPALLVSVECATVSLILITACGVPLAYLLSRSKRRVASLVGTLVQLPLALPPLMSGILLVYLVGPYTFLGRLFGGHLTDSLTGVVLAQTFVAAPFLIVAARASFSSVDPALLDVAATLGHSELSRFRRVAIPQAAHGIRAGMVLAWLRAFGEYGATVILAYHPFSLPIYTYDQFSGIGLPTTMAPTALALGVAATVVALSHLRPSRPRARAAVPSPQPPAVVTARPVAFDLDHHVGSFHLTVAYRPAGSRLAILGPSGSGKSVLLRCLAGLYGSAPGPVWYGDEPVAGVAAERRGVGYLAQGFALFPNLTVWQQLQFAKGATEQKAAYWLERLRLVGLQDRYPSELSGGQRQRVGLAQALCRSPELLLLDEPFSALDAPIRRELRRELRRLQHESGIATVLVTHDPEEAAYLADEVIVISAGRELQSGSSRQVFARPRSPQVARLLGIPNLHPGIVASQGLIDSNGALIAADCGGLEPGTSVLWSIRPERVLVSEIGGLRGTLIDIADLVSAVEMLISLNDELEIQVRTTEEMDVHVGQRCGVELPSDAISVWPVSESAPRTAHFPAPSIAR